MTSNVPDIYSAFARQVARTPEAPALCGACAPLTYAQVETRAQAVARALQDAGLAPGDPVALYGQRSVSLLPGLFGCLAAGGVVVPLDPDFASERLGFILTDTAPRALVCAPDDLAAARALAPGLPIVPTEGLSGRATPVAIDPEAPAFVLYTSGSTGTPKGVVLPHRAVTTYEFGPGDLAVTDKDVVLHASTLACDGMLPEAVAPLLRGASVAVVEAAPVSVSALAEVIARDGVTVVPLYTGLLNLMIDARVDAFAPVRMILSGGEAMSLPRIRTLTARWPDLTVVNEFGPTETCIGSLAHVVTAADLDAGVIPIGTPLAGEDALLLGRDLTPVTGGVGQIAIAGTGLALGYLNRPDRTEAAFVPDPRDGSAGLVYLTGDLAERRTDGAFVYHGRADRQMKLAGRRVELDGIEAALAAAPSVADVVVEPVTGPGGHKQLVAFVQTTGPVAADYPAQLRVEAGGDIHDHVFPRRIEIRDVFPLTQNGKVDRKALLATLSEAAPAPAPVAQDIAGTVARIWQEVLGGPLPKPADRFFDLGGTSLQLIEAHARIEAALSLRFDIALMFEVPKLGDLIARLSALGTGTAPQGAPRADTREGAIAVVGMAVRLPGIDTLGAFWDLIETGGTTVERIPPEELEDSYDAATRARPDYVPARAILRDVDQFDPKFFGLMPLEAARIDPQGRVFLELCQQALDNAGLDPMRTPGRVGLYAGSSMSTYLLQNLLRDREGVARFTSGFQLDYTELAGNVGDDIPSRTAQKLGLTGPAMSVTTACSTGLVAVIQACEALRAGRVHTAMAGGVSITFPQKRGYLAMEGGMASLDGTCRPFDADANGTIFGDGAGVVVLKRLSDALAEGDTIHAVVRGTGLSNDGGRGMSYTAPSVTGQAEAITDALTDAGIAGADVGFVECHGTATPLGDPVEIAGLKAALGPVRGAALGAVKGNLGHLDAAAGIAGFIKACLVLSHGVIPPVAHHRRLNPQIDLEGSGLHVPTAATPWDADGPRYAGVSAFGVGGSNAHVILQSAPDRGTALPVDAPMILPLSAKTGAALKVMAGALADHLEGSDQALADVARTLQQGRRTWDWRGGVVARDRAGAIAALRRMRAARAPAPDGPRLVMLMPGQGAQYPGMAGPLHAAEPVFAAAFDTGLAALPPEVAEELRPLLLDTPDDFETAARTLAQTRLAQPALLMTEVAMARLWQARGVQADLYIGHSVGELAAAVLAGVVDMAQAVTFVTRRGALMQAQDAGGMTAVSATENELTALMDGTVDLAARNGPDQQVIAGSLAALDTFEAKLTAADVTFRRLRSSHAFHSRMMDDVVPALLEVAQAMTLRAPTHPILSTVTGQPLTDAQATDPAYWAGQARACVDFRAALATLATQDAPPAMLEVGPGRTLAALTAQCLPPEAYLDAQPSMPDPAHVTEARDLLAATALRLWQTGVGVTLGTDIPGSARKVPLPSYPFERQRCWFDAAPETPQAAPAAPPAIAETPISPVVTGSPMSQAAAPTVLPALLDLIADMAGMELAPDDADSSFLELGLDSLFLGQLTQEIGRTFKVQFGFRRLTGDLGTPTALADFILAENPAAAPAAASTPEATPAPVAAAAPAPAMLQAPVPAQMPPLAAGSDTATIMQAQMAAMQALFSQQLAALGGAAPVQAQPVAAPAPVAAPVAPVPVAATDPAPAEPKASGRRRAAMISNAELTEDQRVFARDLAARYSAKYPGSKAHTDQYRLVHADPRTASGFHADWKELAFPIVAERAKGAYITDLDGNDLIDLVNGFGQTAFGHAPDFVGRAVAKQLEKGYALGPQAERAGPLAEKFARAVGHERVSFCNTGTEAVIAAVRAARTATGREKVVLFDKSYHGQHDEVLVKPGANAAKPTALPSAPGIPRGGLGNVVVLPFASPEALDYIRENADDLAAVLIESVRSRYPAERPEQFVRDIKAITDQHEAALIMDEVVTGFRTHARGMQGVWGIQGDMAVYGKVVGGGLPIGVLAGSRKFMDALDGGPWQFGDDSRPEAMPTFVAGTFVRHPLVLAAVEACLDWMADHGDRLWVETADLLAGMATRMRAALDARGLPDVIEDYSSWLVVDLTDLDPRATLLYPLMRLQGVHVMDGFCWFLTTEHGQAEVDRVVAAFEQSLDTLLSVGILADVRRADAPPLPARPEATEIRPLTASQREIWMRHQLGGLAAAAFNESGTLWFEGDLDTDALRAALSGTVARRDALRLRFARDGSGFAVTPPEALDLTVTDLSGAADPDAALTEVLAQDAQTAFDLTEDAPIRARLFKLADTRHALMITAHHIVLDGWSFGLILDDLAALYEGARTGADAGLPAAPRFADYAARPAKRDEALATFWKDTFADVPALPDLPTDRPRRMSADRPGATVVHEIPRAVVNDLKALGAKHGCTIFSVTFAAMQALVHRLSGATDIVIGVPTAAQQAAAPGDLVGHLVNFLPIRSQADPDAQVTRHLQSVRDAIYAALDHDGMTFGEILDVAEVPRRLDRLPLTEIEFNLEEPAPLTFADVATRFETNPKAAVTFDLFFNLVVEDSGLRIEAHYASDLFDAATVRAWADSYETLLRAMVATPEARLDDLALTQTVAAPVAQQDHPALPALLADVVARRGDATALETATGTTSYADLWAQSGAIAAAIQATGTTGRVAVCLPRGGALIPALLGVLRAGCAFVPLDPKQPDARLGKILDDAAPGLILTDDTARFADRQVMTPDVAMAVPADMTLTPDAPAYVIYTSGSTGTPKGVEVPHRALSNLLLSMVAEPGLSEDDRLLAVTTAMFDISILEMFGPLVAGARVVLAPAEDVIDGFKLAARLNRGDITVMQATPTLWSILLTAGVTLPDGFRAWAGGEPLPRDLAAQLLDTGAEVWNLYGPTETTIWSAVKQVTPGGDITIGGPIAQTELHVLDASGAPCPVGVVGELNIGGAGLALGYAGQPDRTAQAFRDVTIDGTARRLYATGDMAKRRADGDIDVLGRRDGQVKLRGFRIDLGEIEAMLRAHPAITAAAVDLRARRDGDPQLVGYVTGPGEMPDGPTLMRALAADLPDYMIPTAWMHLDALPQTANGKLDRKALPTPDLAPRAVQTDVPPETATEQRLAAIWSDVLGQPVGDVTTTLLDLGADSLSIFRLAARLLAEDMELEARHLFEHPSVRALAAFYDSRDAEGAPKTARPKLSDFRRGARRAAGDKA
ncbi:non-ribosomal peptide synthetase/type I polyketide synthase [Jannaschia sp. M317]|uniref:non-ribosomal peptide synthetase/type I polyketide synthase n=1 Tax=Jannaschia sp. M317 TaxID=2867011 RepID=UPI0021A3D83E|nr:non-ribosomal peptide synthetase/type I polyketide synthase [Jannaschia sp. M317]UWQ19947.1 amino acid adenylation domain-containing protein [Jannaschia sp. M317]